MDEPTLRKYCLNRANFKPVFKTQNSWNDITNLSKKESKRLFDDKEVKRMERTIEKLLGTITEREKLEEKDLQFRSENHQSIKSLRKNNKVFNSITNSSVCSTNRKSKDFTDNTRIFKSNEPRRQIIQGMLTERLNSSQNSSKEINYNKQKNNYLSLNS